MLKAIKTDLDDITDAMEHLTASLARLMMGEKVDVAARTRAIAKAARIIDELVKEEIHRLCGGKDQYVLGEVFKAYRQTVEVTRVDLTKLEVDFQKVYQKCLTTSKVSRINFEPR